MGKPRYIFKCPCCGAPLGNRNKLQICKEGHTFKEMYFDGNVNAGPLLKVELVSEHSCCKIGTQFRIIGEYVSEATDPNQKKKTV